jgi:hypothetical protein
VENESYFNLTKLGATPSRPQLPDGGQRLTVGEMLEQQVGAKGKEAEGYTVNVDGRSVGLNDVIMPGSNVVVLKSLRLGD